MNILINYKKTNKRFEEFPIVKLLTDREVFVDMPICTIDFNEDIDHTQDYVLYGNYKGISTVYTVDALKDILSTLVKYYMIIDDNKLKVVEPNTKGAQIFRLPKDVDIDKLRFVNNRIIMLTEEELENEKESGEN